MTPTLTHRLGFANDTVIFCRPVLDFEDGKAADLEAIRREAETASIEIEADDVRIFRVALVDDEDADELPDGWEVIWDNGAFLPLSAKCAIGPKQS